MAHYTLEVNPKEGQMLDKKEGQKGEGSGAGVLSVNLAAVAAMGLVSVLMSMM